MTQINNLENIVKNGLCIGCGLCQSITGKDYIKISMSSKGRLEPKEIKKISSKTFNKILNVCPGVIVEGLIISLNKELHSHFSLSNCTSFQRASKEMGIFKTFINSPIMILGVNE